MNCLKCGREVRSGQVFCPNCLADMEKYPVKPDAKVYIPVQPAQGQRRPPRPSRRDSMQQMIRRQRKTIRRLTVALVTVCLLLVLAVGASVLYYVLDQDDGFAIGQNYSTTQPAAQGDTLP